MRRTTLFFLIIASLLLSCRSVNFKGSGTSAPKHDDWTQLLKEHVAENGAVDYPGFIKDSSALNTYLELLSNTPPDDDKWSREEQIAYWINVYNAFTVKLIIDHYPVESIKDIGSKINIPFVTTPWDIKFFNIGEEKMDLNLVEHGQLRKKLEEPRIHFAIVCASVSCPKLRREAFEAKSLEQQLDNSAREFLSDTLRNQVSAEQPRISKIFKWFTGDFTEEMTLIEYLNQYAPVKITENTEIEYMEYNWALNE
ncbi:MAG: DUF547 domain-containing protein, partial [Chitinophagales bacterium]